MSDEEVSGIPEVLVDPGEVERQLLEAPVVLTHRHDHLRPIVALAAEGQAGRLRYQERYLA